MKHPKGPQQIVIAGRQLKWNRKTISYEEIVAEWNKIDSSRSVQGQPGIDWRNEYVEGAGILYPGETVPVNDGLVITIDASHLS